ncbi:gp58-like family protein [Enterococcus faecalis]
MLKVSERFLEKIKSMDRNIVTRITAKNKVYTGNDVNYLKLDYGAMVGDSLQIGSTYSNSLEIEFCSVITDFEEMDEIVIELGVVIHDAESDISSVKPAKVGSAKIGSVKLVGYKPTEYEYVNMGTFYITESDPDRNEKKTTIKALDSFVYMEGMYKSELPEMETIRNIAIDIANKAGIKVDLSSFNGLSTVRIKTPKNCTYRQAIGMIAQFECGYAHFNRDGLLTIRNLTDPRFQITPSEYFMKGLKKNELMYKLGGISCEVRSDEEGSSETILLKAGSDKGAQIKLSNNSMTQTLLDDMYVKLRNLNFYPYNLSWRGNPALEVGDWITFTDREGNKFKSPNLSYSLEYRGGLKGTSSADTKAISSQTTQFKGPIQQQLDDLYSRVDAAGKNNVYDGTDEPKNPKEGDLWFKPNGPDTEIWIYRDGKWVMQTSTALDEDIKEKIENSTPSDEIVKTINLSQEMDGKEWLKITGAKIWLTDQTKIDDAIITHGMIGSVDAGTIKVGTLDAGKIRVVNLDASAISTGTLTAVNIEGVKIKSATITSIGQDFTMVEDNGAITWKRNSDGKEIFSFYTTLMNQKEGNVRLDVSDEGSFTIRSKKHGKSFLSFYGATNDMSGLAYLDTFNIIGSKSSLSYKPTGFDYYSFSNKNPRLYSTDTGFYIGNNDVRVLSNNGSISIRSVSTEISGNLRVTGSKNSLIDTENYGKRLLNAYETPEYYFADYGKSVTGSDGKVKIEIESVFLETIFTNNENYHVMLSPYGEGSIWVEEIKSTYFIVKSEKPETPFSWNIIAYRKNYEDVRLSQPQ